MASTSIERTRSGPGRARHVDVEVMGTMVTFDVFDDAGVDPGEVEVHLDLACAMLHDVDRVFSTWQPESPISRLRRGELGVTVLSPEIEDVLASCLVARSLSGGWFDPWSMPGGVDPTGYVKGWAAQRALDAIARSGVRSAIVNAAGDIASIGELGPGIPFRIGVVNPSLPRQLACVVELRGAIATSGTYERGAHLIDPHTRSPGACVASASVTGPDLGLADALATALCVGGVDVLRLIEDLGAYEAFTIGHDGTRSCTPAFPFA